MKLDFASHTRRNMVAGLLNSGVKLLFPFLNRTLFLWLLGPEFLGLNGLFGSVIGVLSLAELGFGTAVVCSMYKPVADDDKELICAYLRFYRRVYRWVGTAIFAAGLALLPFLDRLVHGSLPPGISLHVLYLVHLANTSLSYFLFAYRGSVLAAYARRDVLSHIASFVAVAQYLAVFLILLLARKAYSPAGAYYAYVGATVAFTGLNNLLLFRESRRLFPEISPRGTLSPERRRRVLDDVGNIFLHKVGGAITNQADNLVISAALGLVAVAAYGNYYYVATSVAGLVGAIHISTLGGFGNKIHTESKTDNFRLFLKTNRLSMAVVTACAALMTALYQPFIEVWTRHDPSLVRHALTPVLMVLYFFVNQARQPLLTFKSAAGLWKEDRWKPIVAGAANLAINISLVICLPEEWKLDGVIFSTVVTLLFIQMPWEAHVVFSRFFSRRHGRIYWRIQAEFTLLGLALCSAAWLVSNSVLLEGIPGLFLKGFAVSCGVFAVMLSVFRKDIPDLVQAIRSR